MLNIAHAQSKLWFLGCLHRVTIHVASTASHVTAAFSTHLDLTQLHVGSVAQW